MKSERPMGANAAAAVAKFKASMLAHAVAELAKAHADLAALHLTERQHAMLRTRIEMSVAFWSAQVK